MIIISVQLISKLSNQISDTGSVAPKINSIYFEGEVSFV